MYCIIPNDVVQNPCTSMCIQRENNDIVYQRHYFPNGLKTIKFASACRRQKYYVLTAEGRRTIDQLFKRFSLLPLWHCYYYYCYFLFSFNSRSVHDSRHRRHLYHRIFYSSSRSSRFAGYYYKTESFV